MPRTISRQPPDPKCRVLKTGQTTQYSSELDDGFYEAGIAKSYTVLTAGQYSGTANVDLVHYAAATISFDAASKEIRDSANGMAIFKTGDIIVVTGSASNDGTYTVATGNVAAKAIVTEALADEGAAATVSIAKREAKSNNCVVDNNTGLMWLRDPSNYPAKMGAASAGKMEWTGTLYDIFAYCAACNTAAVGGHTDWRVANRIELHDLTNWALTHAYPDPTAFPHWPGDDAIWTSTTYGTSDTTRAYAGISYSLVTYQYLKTGAHYVALVRGGI